MPDTVTTKAQRGKAATETIFGRGYPGSRRSFLPDGRRFFYFGLPTAEPEKGGIYLASLDGKENRRVLADASRVAVELSNPASRRGQIVFLHKINLAAQSFAASTG
jgi:hypothetical protein